MEIVEKYTSFGGTQLVIDHDSNATKSSMRLGVYLPPKQKIVDVLKKVPVLFYLSGLTCNWENVSTKSGFQAYASKAGIAVITPDTSPRGNALDGTKIHDVDAYDLGQGASFYVNATQKPWATHFAMEQYICNDVFELLAKNFDNELDLSRVGITGHSMGGHGALTLGMRHSDLFQSISAFAPICAPSSGTWGQQQLQEYLGSDEKKWQEHDASHLIGTHGWKGQILVDQGSKDPFLDSHLRPQMLIEAANKHHVNLKLRMQAGYDHSYFFVASFIGEHIKWHVKNLQFFNI